MDILIADDHDLIRVGIKNKLESILELNEIYEAFDADSVLSTLQQNDNIEIIILDLCMPGVNGLDLLRKILERHPDKLVAVISSTEDVHNMRKVIDLGASGFIPKSSPYQVMLNAIRLIMSGGVYIPENLFKDRDKLQDSIDADDDRLLTRRQKDVLRCLSKGMSNKEIARDLNISENTTKIHISTIFKTLNVNNRTQAGIIAREKNII